MKPGPPLIIAIVGAESTGKTTLARALARRLATDAPQARVAWVPELLRQWCDERGRTPRADEQAALLRAQHERIRCAAAAHDIVVADTTALTTAVYSRLVFGDRSLDAEAAALHMSDVAQTLLTAIDLPWRPDGLQRDGPHVRVPVDDALRELLQAHRIGHAVIGGHGDERLAQALRALSAATAATAAPAASAASAAPSAEPSVAPPGPGHGLFTQRSEEVARTTTHGTPARRWICDCCVPRAERALMSRRAPSTAPQRKT